MIVRIITAIMNTFQEIRFKQLRRQGLQVADDLVLNGLPNFGSEPYLVSIGRHVEISGRVTFITHDGGTYVFRARPGFEHVIKYGRITVHDNCFVGYGAIIMPGVSIGPNSVVAAGSVITKDVPPGTVAGGNPARVLMTTDEYAERSLDRTPEYDRDKYARDAKNEILRRFPYPW